MLKKLTLKQGRKQYNQGFQKWYLDGTRKLSGLQQKGSFCSFIQNNEDLCAKFNRFRERFRGYILRGTPQTSYEAGESHKKTCSEKNELTTHDQI